VIGDGFGFTYDLATAPVVATPMMSALDFVAAPLTPGIPETSTWAMMLVGFAGLAFAGYRRWRNCAAFAVTLRLCRTPSNLGRVFSFPTAVS